MRSGDITGVAGVTGVDLVLHCNTDLISDLGFFFLFTCLFPVSPVIFKKNN